MQGVGIVAFCLADDGEFEIRDERIVATRAVALRQLLTMSRSRGRLYENQAAAADERRGAVLTVRNDRERRSRLSGTARRLSRTEGLYERLGKRACSGREHKCPASLLHLARCSPFP